MGLSCASRLKPCSPPCQQSQARKVRQLHRTPTHLKSQAKEATPSPAPNPQSEEGTGQVMKELEELEEEELASPPSSSSPRR